MLKVERKVGLCKSAGPGAGVTDEMLAKINRFALSPLKAEDVYARKMRLAHNAIDRDKERFSEGVLKKFADTLPGKSLLMGHQQGPPGKGLFFDAYLEEVSLEEAKSLTHEELILPSTLDRVSNTCQRAFVSPLARRCSSISPRQRRPSSVASTPISAARM